MKNKSAKRFLAVMLAFAMVLTGAAASMVSGQAASAAKKVTLKLSKSSITLNKGKSKTLKVTKKNVKKVKSTKWSTSKKSVATVSKKGKVTAKKAGKTTIKCTVKYTVKGSKKVKSKTLKCKVTVKAATTTNTQPPTNTSAPTQTSTPAPAPTQVSDYSVIDMSDPMEGVKDAATVTDAEVNADVTNVGESHTSTGGVTSKDNGMMRKKLTAHQTTEFMGLGWNLANTMEACGGTGALPSDYETLWGQPTTTQKIIDGIKASGFNSIRIPVAWSNMMADDGTYTINQAYMKRVETIVNYCLNDELYVVLNIHYDGGWWGMFGSADKDVQAQAWKKYVRIWEQIAARFNEYSDRLIFESANEELGDGVNESNLGLNTAVDGVKGKLTQDEIYEKVNAINQKFVEVVRKTGGNNAYRQLLIAGFCTDLGKTCDDRYKMPADTVKANGKEKLHVSIHYYDPGAYCIGEDATSSFYSDSWGVDPEYKDGQIQTMHSNLDKMAKFTDQGYGVIIGECGPQTMSKKGVIEFYRELATYGMPRHMVPMWWNLSMYDRTDWVVTYSDIADLLRDITGAENIPLEEGADITGVPSIEVVDESTMEKVAEWTGRWTRTNGQSENVGGQPVKGDDEVGGFEAGTASDGMEVKSNAFWWQMFVKYDWSELTKPCIKITMASDDVSKDAAFQMGYGSDQGDKDPAFTKVDEYDNATYASKIFTLKPAKLEIKPWVCLTTQTQGASIVKIEIYDEKK